MREKYPFKLTLACLLALIGWVNPGWASNVADSCQQLYKNGQYEQAFPVCSKAAEQGDAAAQFNLGLMYDFGRSVQQDYAEAVKWYRKAAEQGFAKAQYNLGVMYGSGIGVLKSGAAAADWYYKAGLSYLKEGKRDDALRCMERIKELKTALHLNVPNAFLADKLLADIYGGGVPNASPAQEEKSEVKQGTVSFGTGWPVLSGFVLTNYHVVKGHEEFLLLCKDGQKIPVVGDTHRLHKEPT